MSGEERSRTTPSPAPTDQAKARARFENMFETHYNAMWRTLRRMGVSDALADDAAQQVFLVAARKLDVIRVGEEGRFLYGIALRVASEIRRRNPPSPPFEPDALERISDEAPGAEQILLAHEARAALDLVLEGMPLDLREVFVLVELEQLSAPEVASLLCVPVGTVASRLRRAREAFTESARRERVRMKRESP